MSLCEEEKRGGISLNELINRVDVGVKSPDIGIANVTTLTSNCELLTNFIRHSHMMTTRRTCDPILPVAVIRETTEYDLIIVAIALRG